MRQSFSAVVFSLLTLALATQAQPVMSPGLVQPAASQDPASAVRHDLSQDEDVSAVEEEEFDPFAADAEETLQRFDRAIEAETGESPFLQNPLLQLVDTGCYRSSCSVWAHVDKAAQKLQLYIDGVLQEEWLVSTGVKGRGTPDFDKHPNGRIYDKHTSNTFPGGDYKGLGNMPYAVFIEGGFAIHGTPKGNWSKLGRRASHGCIRLHPDNAFRFNRLVRSVGIQNVWITVD